MFTVDTSKSALPRKIVQPSMECKKSKERRLIINHGLGGNLPFSVLTI